MQGKSNSTAVFDVTPALPHQRVDHEIDKARQREYGCWLLVGLVLLAAMLFNGYQRLSTVDRGYRIEEIQRQRQQEEVLGRQLRLEIATYSSPEYIANAAVNKLHLVAPGREDAFVVERVVPAPQPPSSVVALR
jgi:hypothetical protein